MPVIFRRDSNCFGQIMGKKGVNRIILPANELKTVGDASKAVTLIVGMGE